MTKRRSFLVQYLSVSSAVLAKYWPGSSDVFSAAWRLTGRQWAMGFFVARTRPGAFRQAGDAWCSARPQTAIDRRCGPRWWYLPGYSAESVALPLHHSALRMDLRHVGRQ